MSDVQTNSLSIPILEQQHVAPTNANNDNDESENNHHNSNNNAYNVSLSRPPSYLPHSDTERQLQHQRDLQVLQQLGEYYYRQRQRDDYFNRLFFNDIQDNESTEKYKMRDAFKVCCLGQFKGILMAFWTLVFVFLGAISVFVPSLPKAAHALWIPLIVYIVTSFCVFKYNQKEVAHIDSLERYVLEARNRRRQEIHQAEQHFQLPDGHFFEIQYPKEHGHPVVTLLPPPPTYSPIPTPQPY
ncbi:hypothetical protein K501DRAFT_276810 [Backusella circina FSU 941]|nr:hypothetical protein K501DRAFT_276810 [Backusella circina FSU 941]